MSDAIPVTQLWQALESYAQGVGIGNSFCLLLRPSRAPLHTETLVLNFFTDGPPISQTIHP